MIMSTERSALSRLLIDQIGGLDSCYLPFNESAGDDDDDHCHDYYDCHDHDYDDHDHYYHHTLVMLILISLLL